MTIRRLQKADLLEHKGYDRTSQAKLWKIKKKSNWPVQEERNEYTTPPWLSNSVLIALSDATERGALGKTATMVYGGLLDCAEPVMPTPLARRLKLSRHQVQRALGKLKGYGLALREEAGWVGIEVEGEWLDEHVAAPAGTLGKGEERKQKHAEERSRRAGQQLLGVRYAERRRDAARGDGQRSTIERRQTYRVLYCQECGQTIFVFEGDTPPDVCSFCAEKTGEKNRAVWEVMSQQRGHNHREPPDG